MSEYDPNYVDPKNYYLLGVKVAILNENNEVLLVRRSLQIPRGGGDWDLVGGGVDAHESPEDGAKREAREETGIELDALRIISSDLFEEGDDSVVLLGFSARIDNAQPTLSWEHDEYKWVPAAEIESQELPEYYRRIVRASL